ncbi:glycoside hydrolase family 3 protein [Sphingomonas sp. CFBP 13728]|uniref:beta-glucosidase family protein n=1 Tax=Sphingomonas sp. CFBP 13728 TaxID=2775294 RepID=UPI0017804AAE|nr:beta-glucosidase [Sphingomonas sp. CFBP 13728]MBD8621037.1 glycoside hydrolase family 3 protein [Sphingomonas sp. CFBP 13728]
MSNRFYGMLLGASLLALAGAVDARDAGKPGTTIAASADARARAQALVARMTLDEKIALAHGLFPPMAAGKTANELIPSAGHIDGIPRLGIPLVRESDASLGVANQVEQRKGDVATALPSSLATAASFDVAIARAGGTMIGAEARAKRFNVLLAGGVNLTRDPWNGRNFEYLGEDPLLAGEMAGAHIAGVQSNHIVSTVKHLALNAQETGRMVVDARIDEASLRMSDLLAFQIAIEKGRPGSVMCAYNKINGDWACENRHLMTDVLKRDWGYRGWVMSDWGAVHSTAKAANAGLDQQSGQELDKAMYFAAPLKAAVQSGAVPVARLDDMIARYLTGLIETGAYDNPVPAAAQVPPYAAHAEVAQRAAEAGIVLLKNDGDLLPVARTAKRIVLIGGRADVGVLSGGGSSQVRSVGGAPIEIPLTSGAAMSFARYTYHASSPLKALQAVLPGATVTFVDGKDVAAAAAAARAADIAIVFATQWTTEAQDVPDLSLPDNQDALIAAVAKAQPRTVAVLETGGPVLMPWIGSVPAVLQAWYPGQRGGEAIADILTGKVSPSGRLPITFPAAALQAPRAAPVGLDRLTSVEAQAAANPANASTFQLESFPVDYVEGANVGYRWYEKQRRRPLFAFGHGLSYTSFAYRNPVVTGGRSLNVTFEITNTGKRAGADVPQMYVARDGSATPMRLAGFTRVTLKPGETRRVMLTAEPRIVADYDTTLPGWRIAGGAYRVALAHDAQDRALVVTTRLDAATMKP